MGRITVENGTFKGGYTMPMRFLRDFHEKQLAKQPRAWVQLLEQVQYKEDISYHLGKKLQMLQIRITQQQRKIETAERDLEFEKKAFQLINAQRKRAKKRRLKVPVK